MEASAVEMIWRFVRLEACWAAGSADYSMRRQNGSRVIELLEGNEALGSLISTAFGVNLADQKRHHDGHAISEASEEHLKGRHTISGLTYHKRRCARGRRFAMRLSIRLEVPDAGSD